MVCSLNFHFYATHIAFHVLSSTVAACFIAIIACLFIFVAHRYCPCGNNLANNTITANSSMGSHRNALQRAVHTHIYSYTKKLIPYTQ